MHDRYGDGHDARDAVVKAPFRPRRATTQVGEALRAQTAGYLSEPLSGRREGAAVEPAPAELVEPRPPALRAAAYAGGTGVLPVTSGPAAHSWVAPP
jgi:hypothetical protein